jgi:NAD dependent epimerase/dehydratase family enzyme
MADSLLTGQRVSPQKAIESGYAFRYPTLAPALSAIFHKGEIP